MSTLRLLPHALVAFVLRMGAAQSPGQSLATWDVQQSGLHDRPASFWLALPEQTPVEKFEMIVPMAGSAPLRVALWPHSQRSERFQVTLGDGTSLGLDELPPVRTFAGSVVNKPGSVVAGSLHESGWQLIIDTGQADESYIYVQPWAELYPEDGRGPGTHAVFAANQLASIDGVCGGAPVSPQATTPRGGYWARSGCIMTADIAFDADYELFVANGSSVAATIADVESVLNAVDLIYARDVGIDHAITTIIVRDNIIDPYSTTDAYAALREFADHWQNNQGAVQRDVAHLMTGREIDGNIIGVAYLNAVCGYGYGYSQTRYTGNLAFRAGLTAHELGHNWGANHCDGDSDCFIMCGGIGGCSGNVTRFGNRSMRDITTFRDSRTCLAAGAAFPTPLAPAARSDTAATVTNAPVLVDVLNNDIDGNCELIIISGFTSITANATIARSVGTGPGGRDQLRYTPRAGYVGNEAFSYSIADSTGRQSASTVLVSVLALRSPETIPFPRAGLEATYYELLPQYVPDFTRHPQVASNVVADINFPSGNGVFAGSGRTINVGARFIGTLTIPTSGAYTFFTESDDGSVLYINDQLIVANDGVQGMTERGGAISLLAGAATFRLEYFQGEGNAGLIARIQGPGIAKQVIPAALFGSVGLAATYYGFAGSPSDMPALGALTPVLRNIIGELNQSANARWMLSSARTYSIAGRFTGYVTVPVSGIYTFFTSSDDGSTLNIGTNRIVSNGGPHGMIERSGFAALAAGTHPLNVEFWQGGGGGGLVVSMAGPGLAKAPIPAAMLWHTPPGAADCDADALLDRESTIVTFDAGDMLVGGNGTVNAIRTGRGVNPLTGRLALPDAFSGSRNAGPATFVALDGLSGRLFAPFVDGVFIPNGNTRISRDGSLYRFSPTIGGYWNAMRNAFSDTTAIIAPDMPGVTRRGLGMHANSGVTFNLAALRAANGGRPIYSFDGLAAINVDACDGGDLHIELHALVDGVTAYRRLLSPRANFGEPFSISLPFGANKLTLASIEADGNNCDHFVIADARFIGAAGNDLTFDRIPDVCQCPADFNQDGGVDGGDVEAFFVAWSAAEIRSDVNFDGGVDGADVEFFFSAWSAGGC